MTKMRMLAVTSYYGLVMVVCKESVTFIAPMLLSITFYYSPLVCLDGT